MTTWNKYKKKFSIFHKIKEVVLFATVYIEVSHIIWIKNWLVEKCEYMLTQKVYENNFIK